MNMIRHNNILFYLDVFIYVIHFFYAVLSNLTVFCQSDFRVVEDADPYKLRNTQFCFNI